MGQIRYVSCSQLRTGDTYTYERPANKLTGDCESYWETENSKHRTENLTLPDCRKTVKSITICDVGGERVDHSVTYRVIDPTPDPTTTVTPSGIEIWLPILLFLVGLYIALFIMYRLKMFCFKRANGPNSADGNCDLRDAEDGISGASHLLNNNQTSSGPNCNGVNTDHRNGGENIPMVSVMEDLPH